jgi:hypothetical protein
LLSTRISQVRGVWHPFRATGESARRYDEAPADESSRGLGQGHDAYDAGTVRRDFRAVY